MKSATRAYITVSRLAGAEKCTLIIDLLTRTHLKGGKRTSLMRIECDLKSFLNATRNRLTRNRTYGQCVMSQKKELKCFAVLLYTKRTGEGVKKGGIKSVTMFFTQPRSQAN